MEKASKFFKIAGICGIGTFLVFGITFLRNKASAESLSQDAALSNTATAAGKVIEIKEKLFIAQTNEIYLNSEDYLGKTIRLEGLFKTEQYDGEEPFCFVLRYGPGCCGYDGTAGFEVAWAPRTAAPNGEGSQSNVLAPKYPQEDEWVEAVGTLSSYEEDDYPYIYLQLTSLTVKKDRGAEFVSQ
ncbi:MAG: hypothetical protein LBT00_08120 [Spirochaetaceae bacterium]|jgi:uncharacterized membrane protein YcgQ (UPF0703/DUF1980 family)|nr:hypothetical protein [Spirochaetaceae bacterium]